LLELYVSSVNFIVVLIMTAVKGGREGSEGLGGDGGKGKEIEGRGREKRGMGKM
jgi:hypothetical protein